MKRIIMLAMVLVMMVVSIGGCWVGGMEMTGVEEVEDMTGVEDMTRVERLTEVENTTGVEDMIGTEDMKNDVKKEDEDGEKNLVEHRDHH